MNRAWDNSWMQMAHLLAERSRDPKTKVGCVVVSSDNRIVLGTGYNGYASGGNNERSNLNDGMSGTIHAEINALLMPYKALNLSTVLGSKEAVLYVTHLPCEMCANVIAELKFVRRVVYNHSYGDVHKVLGVFEHFGIVCTRLDGFAAPSAQPVETQSDVQDQ